MKNGTQLVDIKDFALMFFLLWCLFIIQKSWRWHFFPCAYMILRHTTKSCPMIGQII